MKTLFEPTVLGNIKVKNRLVRSATLDHSGDENGRLNEAKASPYKKLAQGGVGTIISGMVGADENSRIFPSMIKAYDPTFEDQTRYLADYIHSYDCRLVVQVAHCGAKVPQTDSGEPPLGASPLPDSDLREMAVSDIQAVIASFARAAVHCKNGGADGMQLHAAHGYLLSQFLSPLFNFRTDEYGGSIENRARLLFQTYDAVRKAVGKDYPIWCKINCKDMEEGGMTEDEGLWVCKRLSEMGIDAIEVSGGIGTNTENTPVRSVRGIEQEAYFFDEALEIAAQAETDVISVGGYRTLGLIEEKLAAGNIKAISMSRPFMAQPDLPNLWMGGNK